MVDSPVLSVPVTMDTVVFKDILRDYMKRYLLRSRFGNPAAKFDVAYIEGGVALMVNTVWKFHLLRQKPRRNAAKDPA